MTKLGRSPGCGCCLPPRCAVYELDLSTSTDWSTNWTAGSAFTYNATGKVVNVSGSGTATLDLAPLSGQTGDSFSCGLRCTASAAGAILGIRAGNAECKIKHGGSSDGYVHFLIGGSTVQTVDPYLPFSSLFSGQPELYLWSDGTSESAGAAQLNAADKIFDRVNAEKILGDFQTPTFSASTTGEFQLASYAGNWTFDEFFVSKTTAVQANCDEWGPDCANSCWWAADEVTATITFPSDSAAPGTYSSIPFCARDFLADRAEGSLEYISFRRNSTLTRSLCQWEKTGGAFPLVELEVYGDRCAIALGVSDGFGGVDYETWGFGSLPGWPNWATLDVGTYGCDGPFSIPSDSGLGDATLSFVGV